MIACKKSPRRRRALFTPLAGVCRHRVLTSEAGDQGFEPQFPRPERGVLPLHQSPNFRLTDPESAVFSLDEPRSA